MTTHTEKSYRMLKYSVTLGSLHLKTDLLDMNYSRFFFSLVTQLHMQAYVLSVGYVK